MNYKIGLVGIYGDKFFSVFISSRSNFNPHLKFYSNSVSKLIEKCLVTVIIIEIVLSKYKFDAILNWI